MVKTMLYYSMKKNTNNLNTETMTQYNSSRPAVRRRVQSKPAMTPSIATAVLRAEREAWRQRIQSQVTLSPGGRPMCQHCNAEEAQHTGHYRKNGSAILRKSQGLYIGANCHNAMYEIPQYWGPRFKREELAEAY